MNMILSKMLAMFLAAFIMGLGGCAGAFAGAKAIGAIKPKLTDAQVLAYMERHGVDSVGFDDKNGEAP